MKNKEAVLSKQEKVFYTVFKHSSQYNDILPEFPKLFISLSKLHSLPKQPALHLSTVSE